VASPARPRNTQPEFAERRRSDRDRALGDMLGPVGDYFIEFGMGLDVKFL
jgi:hypothetical protein